MRVFLAVATKTRDGSVLGHAVKTARDAVRASFPVPWESVTGEEWHAPGVALLAWSNEPADQPPEGSSG
ncbi:hypothetical protein Misp01_25160 [Microtetraspora sp. NBRC 13810]|uniref:hypothetical protein n=1 Tax=Microtetraspora sp. NBRC 13810 TaxID=3030990 RepID=UPI0024A38287|nr:hypothetical protein [Microtetraspora sp. NBRC 13810]GLW07386.1 hypothetical protein Misp01_25160 [Microtetraspora sp. NBRC 13810]